MEANLIPRPKLVGSLASHAVAEVGAGKAHSLALTESGRVLSFGLQTYGRLGRKEADNGSDQPLTPGEVQLGLAAGDAVTNVSAGETDSLMYMSLASYPTHCTVWRAAF